MDLAPLMRPRSVAVVGASQRMGRGTRVIANLLQFGYAGRIFPVNPKYDEILGLPCYPELGALPEPAESVVVAIPAAEVPALLATAAAQGTRAAVVLSSGFGEAGAAGRERQAALERLTADRGLLICGPNCYGVFNVRLGAATFSADFTAPPRPGAVALVSQSGGFSHAIAEALGQHRAVGLSHIVSCGNQAGVGVEDYLEYLVEDADTEVIGLFVEGFRRPPRLRRAAAAARERCKAIVALKVGRSENARAAMLAHTGSLAGAPEIADAVLRQAGVVQVTSLNEMVDTLTLLAAARAHRGPRERVFVLSGLGGECGHVADAAARVSLELPPLAPASGAALAAFMPAFANPRNPLDGTGAMYEDASLFPRMLDVLLGDAGIDVLAINLRANVPKAGGWAPSRQFTRLIAEALARGTDKLVVAFSSFAGGDLDPEVVEPLAAVGVPFLDGTETAMLALRHARALGARRPAAGAPAPRGADAPAGGTVLGHAEAAGLLQAAGVPLVATVAVQDADGAVGAAEHVGYPVALKVDSPDLPHKSDVGGVRLGCADAAAVRRAGEALLAEVRRRAPAARIAGLLVQPMVTGGVEMILGVKRDPVFGPAVVLGMGGVLVEVLRDVAVRVPPIDAATAREMVAELRGAALLAGVRGRAAADVEALAEVVVRVGRLAEKESGLRALDLNPLVVLGRGVVAVDWLIETD